MIKTRLFVVGAGGHGHSVVEAEEMSGQYAVVGFLDDAAPVGERVLGCYVLGSVAIMADLCRVADHATVAIGNNAVREQLTQQLVDAGFSMATVIHPRAFVSPSTVVGSVSPVMAGAIVGTEARLGLGLIINCGAVVDHHVRVEDFGHLGVNASMAGGTLLGHGVWTQAGAALGVWR